MMFISTFKSTSGEGLYAAQQAVLWNQQNTAANALKEYRGGDRNGSIEPLGVMSAEG